MRVFIAVAALIFTVFSLPRGAAAQSGNVSLRTKLGFSALTGHPDIFGVSLAVGLPNVIELDGGASYKPLSGYALYARLGYPWVAFDSEERKYWLFVVPKVGLRYVSYDGDQGSHCPLYYCDQYTQTTCEYADVDSLGINAVLSFEPTFWVTDRLGILLQISGGATFLVRGHDYEVTRHCNGYDELIIEKPTTVRPDVKVAFGFVF